MKYYSLLSLHPALSQDYLFSSPSTFSANFLIPEYKLQKHHEGTDWTKRLQLRSLSATTSFFLKDTHRDMKWNKAVQFYNLNSIQSALITRKRKQFHFNDCTVDWHIFLGKKKGTEGGRKKEDFPLSVSNNWTWNAGRSGTYLGTEIPWNLYSNLLKTLRGSSWQQHFSRCVGPISQPQKFTEQRACLWIATGFFFLFHFLN